MAKSPVVLLTSAGSGGHLFPLRFVAESLRTLAPSVVLHFVGAGHPLEAQLLTDISRSTIEVPKVNKMGLFAPIRFLLALPRAMVQSIKVIRSVKPDAVFASGGYAAVVPVIAAWLLRIPVWIHEAEPKPGKANLVMSLFARRMSVVAEDALHPFWIRTLVTGHPVRSGLQAARLNQVPEKPRKILVLGGSQGARSLDEAMPQLGGWFAQEQIEIRHQTRPENQAVVQAQYLATNTKASVVAFIDDMIEAYRWCDVIVARAGAGTVWEIAAIGKPALFVPLPSVAQELNAEILVRRGQAIIILKGSDLAERLRVGIESLLDPSRYREMTRHARSNGSSSAAQQIARGVLELAGIG